MDFINTMGIRFTRTTLLVLDNYVRSILTYACPVWGLDWAISGKPKTREEVGFQVIYNDALRQLLRVKKDINLRVLQLLSARKPLSMVLLK